MQGTSPGSLTIFRVSGIPVNFHFTFLLLAAALIFGGYMGGRSLAFEAAYFGGLFGSVLLHELGHALTALRFGVRIASITMYPIGGAARLASQPTPWQELWITVMGPAVNLVIAAVCFAAIRLISFPPDYRELLRGLGVGNIWLLLFNLLPAFPMDGGRLLRAFLALRTNELRATRIASSIGRGVAVLMAVYAIFSGHFLLLFIALMVFTGAQQERVFVESKALSTGVPVHAAMVREFHTLNHGDTIKDAAKLLIDTTQQDFPVVHGTQVVGLLGRNALIQAMNASGPDSYVASAMNRDFVTVEPSMDLSDALPLMQRAGNCALVMDQTKLQGLLTLENIAEFFALRSAQSHN